MADLLIRGASKYGSIIVSHGKAFDAMSGEDYEVVVLPKHGRLIDADELKELFRETITGIATRTDMQGAYEHMIRASAMVIEMIDDAPTVIEASEDGEHDE